MQVTLYMSKVQCKFDFYDVCVWNIFGLESPLLQQN